MTASLDIVVNNHKSPMQSRNALDLSHDNPLGKDDVDISSSSSDPPDTSNTDWNHITKLGMHDVLLGRGGGTNNHEGNVLFRKLVNEHKMRYLACSKVDKPKVAREVVQHWRKMNPPGRFLNRKDETKRGPGSVKDADNVWFEVGDKKAREKASQCLRERTAEVIPYMKQLREHQDAATEHGVSMIPQQLQMHNNNNNQVQQPDNNHNNSMNGNSNHNQGSMNNSSHRNQGQGGMNNSSHNQEAMNNSTHSMNNMNNLYPPAAPVPAFPRRNSQPAPPISPQHAANGSCIPQPYMGRRGSLPVSSAVPQGQGQQTSPYLARRASLNMMPASSAQGAGGNGGGGGGVALDEFYANTAPPLGGSGGMGGDEFYGDMTDLEYEQMIIMQRQHLQMQHMQIQRMRQQRGRAGDTGGAGARRPSLTGIASNPMPAGYELSPQSGNGNHLQSQSYQQQQLQLLYPHMQQQQREQQAQQQQQQQQQNHHVHFSQEQQPLSLQDPLLYMANRTKSPARNSNKNNDNGNSTSIGAAARAGNLAAAAATTVSPRAARRSVDESDYQIGIATPSPASLSGGARRGRGRGRGRKGTGASDVAPPDVAPSSGATFPQVAAVDDVDCAPQDGELTLEEYRQQLEAYMANNPTQSQADGHLDDDDQLDSPSDLEDDWEKERDRAFKKEKKRGVGRNVSGVSFMSTKTDKSNGMSLVSGMSMFSSDLMSMGTTTRENKMNMTRSVGSNLSLMSELTDLSQNIDDLHLFDE